MNIIARGVLGLVAGILLFVVPMLIEATAKLSHVESHIGLMSTGVVLGAASVFAIFFGIVRFLSNNPA